MAVPSYPLVLRTGHWRVHNCETIPVNCYSSLTMGSSSELSVHEMVVVRCWVASSLQWVRQVCGSGLQLAWN
ncbi:hypothetical protein B1J92_D00869g [Nakaseomyces glabratus]|nr:hypothetical protein B1J91_D00869g [Nakaseomyces glabratus]OXB49856.1 hypothetical protein B1J92_D00869g [Nakaseomyces glabratus]